MTTITRKVCGKSSWFLDWIFIKHASSVRDARFILFSLFAFLYLDELSKIGEKMHFFLQIGAISLHFKILENVYPERKPTRYWLKLCCAFLIQSTWHPEIMVKFWHQLSDKVTFEDSYTAKMLFRTFHINIFFILRDKRTTWKKNHCDILCHSIEKKCWILVQKPSHKVEVPLKGIFTTRGHRTNFVKIS